MTHPAGTSRGVGIALAAGTVAAIASILPRSAMFVGDFLVHKTLLALVSVYLWSAAYYLLHRCLVFLSPVWRPLFAPLLLVVWSVAAAPFLLGVLVMGPGFAEYVHAWEAAAGWFTCVAAIVHLCLLLGERLIPVRLRAEPVTSIIRPEVGWVAGLVLAQPAIIVGWAAVFFLQDAIWIVGGTGGGPIVKLLLYSLPAMAGAGLYVAVYCLLWRVSPLCRPLWAPLWGLVWFVLTPLCALLFYGAFVGFLGIVMAYAFTCLTAGCHYLLMLGWRCVSRLRAA